MTDLKIVLDSSADLTELVGIEFASAPLTINTEDRKFIDNSELDVATMVDFLYN